MNKASFGKALSDDSLSVNGYSAPAGYMAIGRDL